MQWAKRFELKIANNVFTRVFTLKCIEVNVLTTLDVLTQIQYLEKMSLIDSLLTRRTH